MDDVQMLVVDIAARIYVEEFKRNGLADESFAKQCVEAAESLVKHAGGESISARHANLEQDYLSLQRKYGELETRYNEVMAKFRRV